MRMSVSETGYGVDVTVRRADDLDRKLLAAVNGRDGCSVLDLGCGAGGAAARLVELGAYVTGIDQHDFKDVFTESVGERGVFMQSDIRNIEACVAGEMFDFVLLQRTLHYLPYAEAKKVLTELCEYTKEKMFLSLSGLQSDLGKVYATVDAPIDRRFGKLTAEGQETFGIYEPLTLYTKAEAVQLAEDSCWKVVEVWQSAFGNIKMILKNKPTL